MRIGLIFATTKDGVFGVNNKLPWKCDLDMKFFRKMTLNSKIAMGRNTMESLGSPLPKRENFVVTSKPEIIPEEFKTLTLDGLLQYSEKEFIWVIGGSLLINELLNNYEDYIDIIVHNIIDDRYCNNITEEDDITYLKYNIYDLNKQTFNLGEGVECNFYHRGSNDHMSLLDKEYLTIGKHIMERPIRECRNGKTRSSFDPDLVLSTSFEEGFPILHSKRVWYKGVKEELEFFLSGSTNSKLLEEKQVKIWTGNTCRDFLDSNGKSHFEEGEMGPMYGFQWRHFGEPYEGLEKDYKGLDQIERVINTIINDPHSRRILMTTYNAAQAEEGVLYPCHGIVTQFYVEDSKISLKTYQRSADWFLGVPFNISSYALLLKYIVDEVNKRMEGVSFSGYIPGNMTTIFGDAHLYEDHISSFLEQYIYSYIIKPLDYTSAYIDSNMDLKEYYPNRAILAPMIS